jgi:DNA ligase (NAD+)
MEYLNECITEMKSLIKTLNNATKAYDEGNPIMTDKEWDNLYFRLLRLESVCSTTLPNSPTQKVIYEVVNKLEKVIHSHPMLSLQKTKEIFDIQAFLGERDAIAMLKMDGLTCSLTYEDGVLVRAETRGDGVVGENILHNVKAIPNVPKRINIKSQLVVDGEIICKTDVFEEKFSTQFKNPRNYAAGAIRRLDANENKNSGLSFVAWDMIGDDELTSTLSNKLWNLRMLGFTIVPYFSEEHFVDVIDDVVNDLKGIATELHYPIDGIVFKWNNIEEYKSAGRTDHHFKGGMAYKFYDETYETRLITIDWTMSRNGTLTPVAVFEPIDIDGSTVERASLHNVSIMREVLGDCAYAGQIIQVYKANQIIPQIASAIKMDYGTVVSKGGISVDGFSGMMLCPICGSGTAIAKSESGTETLVCLNDHCQGKLVNVIDHFCSKKGLDIKGLSKATIEKLIDWEWLSSIKDLYTLKNFKNEWVSKSGFGEKSVQKILDAIEESKNSELWRFISAFGINLIGTTISKEIVKVFPTWEEFRDAVMDDTFNFFTLDGFGIEMHKALKDFDYSEADEIAKLFNFSEIVVNNSNEKSLNGITFCVTGKLNSFKNRDELKSYIESAGGKVVGSMSSKVQYLINNDSTSTSSKNKAAQSAGIPIITEAEFIDAFGQN